MSENGSRVSEAIIRFKDSYILKEGCGATNIDGEYCSIDCLLSMLNDRVHVNVVNN